MTETVVLMGVAVTALSGCMTVPASSKADGGGLPDSVSKPSGEASGAPKAAKPSARVEGSEPETERRGPARQQTQRRDAAVPVPRPAPARQPAIEPAPLPIDPGLLPNRQGGGQPALGVPQPGGAGGAGGAGDLCSLGQQYGHWAPGGAPARICRHNLG